jgi:hypothetical protein
MLEDNLLLNNHFETQNSLLLGLENDLTKTIEELSFVNPLELNDSLNCLQQSVLKLSDYACQLGEFPNLDPITGQALDKAFDYLSKLKDDSELNKKLELAFGDSFDRDIAKQLITDFSRENFTDLPSLEIISGKNINGANGAFAAATNTIYLSSEFIANSNSTDAIAGVILEEIGHYLDSQINNKDASGDEGDIFSRVIRGEQIDAQELNALKLEDDSALMLNGDREIAIEQSLTIPKVLITAPDAIAAETADGSNPGAFAISRDGDLTKALTVKYTVTGTASNGIDYNQLTGTVTIAAGAKSVKLPVNVLDDLGAEYAETVTVTLTQDPSYTLDNSYKSRTLTIQDNDLPKVLITAPDAIAAETADGSNPGAFAISRDGDLTKALTVKYTVTGTASNGIDYNQLTGTVTIAAGAKSVKLPVNVLDDLGAEYAETVTVTLTQDPSYTLDNSYKSRTLTIQDNDSFAINLNTPNGGENIKIASNYEIAWNDNISGNVKVDLYKGGNFLTNIFASTASDGAETWTISKDILAGSDYSIKIVSLDDNNIFDTSNSYFTIASDWFNQNLNDLGIISQMRTLTADNQLSRNDAIAVLRNTKDGNIIDNDEFNDLKKIVANFSNAANANLFNTQDYVRVLTNKVVNGDPANTNTNGTNIGNLAANSNSTQLESLIGKWFLGLDRPDTKYVDQYGNPFLDEYGDPIVDEYGNPIVFDYKFVSGGSLFQNGASYTDIYQGDLGDCYFLAALASNAFRSPSTIASMFIDNGDNTYTVRFYNNGVADYVTVDRYLPVDKNGTFIYARQKADDWGKPSDSANEWWYALAEKAYAQLNESGWIGQNGTNSYSGIIEGFERNTIKQVSGLNVNEYVGLDLDNIVNAFTSGKWVTIGSKSSGVANNIVEGHAYVLVGYDPDTLTFKLFNPWGVGGDPTDTKPGLLELSKMELLASFNTWTLAG